MKIYKLQLSIILMLILFFSVGWQKNCNSPKNDKGAKTNKNMNKKEEIPQRINPGGKNRAPVGNTKILAEGSYGKIENPFIFVARTAENYQVLQNMIENLPAADTIDFDNSAIVAAFAGTKNTGGYSVAISGADGKYSVTVNAPPPDAIVTEALTMPYKIVVAPVNREDKNLVLELSENWAKNSENYKLTGGEIEFSGGIAGKQEKFKPEGSIKIFRAGELVTLFFDLQGKTAGKKYQTKDFASGKITNGIINLPNLEAANLIERPHPPFIVSGTISGEKISLELKKGDADSKVRDGFQGSGKIEAEKIK